MTRVLITGASSGLGEASAFLFGQKGFDLLLVARNKEKLLDIKSEIENKYHNDVRIFDGDLCKEDTALNIYNFCKDNNLKIDVLINNAGIGSFGLFKDSDMTKNRMIIDLNNKSLVELSYYFIQDMLKNGYGHIINVASIASFVPGPYMALYYASKAFVYSFSLALREELKDSNVHVSLVCPGPMQTDFTKKAGSVNKSFFNSFVAMKPERVAAYLYNIYVKNKDFELVGLLNKVAAFSLKVLPVSLCTKIEAEIQKKAKSRG